MKPSTTARSMAVVAACACSVLAGPALGQGREVVAGAVVTVTGPVTIQRGAKGGFPAEAGSPVRPGDTIVTGESGKAQLRMEDDSVFAIVSDSAFAVEKVEVPKPRTAGTALFSLVKGGFRTITGLIGKTARDTYQVRTPLATIGVRGSAYSAVLCEGKCTANGKFKAGLYVKAESGTITVVNDKGQLKLRAGQIAFVESADTPPVRVRKSPFDEPGFAANFSIDIEFDLDVQPPRIEQEPPASPS